MNIASCTEGGPNLLGLTHKKKRDIRTWGVCVVIGAAFGEARNRRIDLKQCRLQSGRTSRRLELGR